MLLLLKVNADDDIDGANNDPSFSSRLLLYLVGVNAFWVEVEYTNGTDPYDENNGYLSRVDIYN
jgi:hypothetical protein